MVCHNTYSVKLYYDIKQVKPIVMPPFRLTAKQHKQWISRWNRHRFNYIHYTGNNLFSVNIIPEYLVMEIDKFNIYMYFLPNFHDIHLHARFNVESLTIISLRNCVIVTVESYTRTFNIQTFACNSHVAKGAFWVFGLAYSWIC